MRYSNFTLDPLSSQLPFCALVIVVCSTSNLSEWALSRYGKVTGCNPSYSGDLTISSRADLNPKVNSNVTFVDEMNIRDVVQKPWKTKYFDE